ncbi:MAG: DUF4007 family protein [Gammaproteobacteria bacterium]|nr:DUF4007 family protein [Gammaproteobacteria bacterium]
MARGLLYQPDYKPLFSGHETFPLRYGWLKKAFDAVAASADKLNNKRTVFLADDAIAQFGVGKNMVASIRHWATAAGVIADDPRDADQLTPTPLGNLIFGPDGRDPYMEMPTTLWLAHWHIAGHTTKTTWYWAFNHFPAKTFRRDDLVSSLLKLAANQGWKRAAEMTLRRDVECFVRTYVSQPAGAQGALEDNLESPLAELALIRLIGKRDDYQFVRGAKPTLTPGVFAYALNAFWNSVRAAQTLSFEMVAHEPGSPGRVFLLDEADLADRLSSLETQTKGQFRWSETAGLKQITRERVLSEDEALRFVENDFAQRPSRKAA